MLCNNYFRHRRANLTKQLRRFFEGICPFVDALPSGGLSASPSSKDDRLELKLDKEASKASTEEGGRGLCGWLVQYCDWNFCSDYSSWSKFCVDAIMVAVVAVSISYILLGDMCL